MYRMDAKRIRPHGFQRWANVTDEERQRMTDAIDAFVPESDELEQHQADEETA